MYSIPPSFCDFISPDCDRAAFIQNYLNSAGIKTCLMPMEGKKHIYVSFPKSQYNPMFRIKTVIAHYDRIGIGANDNSAAVFCLMEWARSCSVPELVEGPHMIQPHNIRIIFTDGEELGEKGGVAQQGAFPLAQMFKRLGITNDDIFVFDCMGRGDVPILSQTVIPPQVPTAYLKSYSQLEARAKQLLQLSSPKYFCLPCSLSDNASFIANGIPAVAITMLPSEEVPLVLEGKTPPTWQSFHTPQDNLEFLTPQSFEIFHTILNNLAQIKTIFSSQI